MRFYIFSDLHLTNKNTRFWFDNNGVSDLLTAQANFVEWLCQLAENDDETCGLIFLGDWTDYSTLDPILQTFSNLLIERLGRTGLPVILLEGNHCITDQENNFTVLSASKHLCKRDNVFFVTEPTKISITNKEKENDVEYNFYCYPFVPDYVELKNRIIQDSLVLNNEEINIMLFHFPTVNALLDNGLLSKRGVHLEEELCNKFMVCLGGDFHTPQQLIGTKNAFYVGAPFQLKINEKGPHGLVVLDVGVDGYEMKRIDNPYNIKQISVDSVDDLRSVEPNTIVKFNVKLSEEQKAEVLKRDFYKVLFSNGKKATKKSEEFSGSLLLDSTLKDIDTLPLYLKELNPSKDVLENALVIFEALEKELN